jgi:hypothetical protein
MLLINGGEFSRRRGCLPSGIHPIYKPNPLDDVDFGLAARHWNIKPPGESAESSMK